MRAAKDKSLMKAPEEVRQALKEEFGSGLSLAFGEAECGGYYWMFVGMEADKMIDPVVYDHETNEPFDPDQVVQWAHIKLDAYRDEYNQYLDEQGWMQQEEQGLAFYMDAY